MLQREWEGMTMPGDIRGENGSHGGLDYRTLFEACSLPILVWRERDGGFLLAAANAAAETFVTAPGGARPGLAPHDLHPDIPGLEADLRHCQDHGGHRSRELCRATTNGDAFSHVRLDCIRVPPDMVLTQVSDVTARKEAEAVRDEMERISRHDLKSPLNVIVGAANLMKADANLDPGQRESLEMIESAGYTMLNLIHVSLDILRIERGDYVYTPRPVDLAVLVRRIVEHMRPRLRGRGLGLELLVEGRPASRASAFIVPGDDALCNCLVEALTRCAMCLASKGDRVRLFMDRVGDEAVVGVRYPGHLEAGALEALRSTRLRTHPRLPSEADLRNAHIVVQAMGGRMELDSTAEETVLAAWLPA